MTPRKTVNSEFVLYGWFSTYVSRNSATHAVSQMGKANVTIVRVLNMACHSISSLESRSDGVLSFERNVMSVIYNWYAGNCTTYVDGHNLM
jgi:hypothetical protein